MILTSQLKLVLLLLSFMVYVVVSDEQVDVLQPDSQPHLKPEAQPDPETDWTDEDDHTGPEQNLGLGRFQYSEILLISRVPSPLNKWDYVVINAANSERYVKESGRADMSSFTKENYPDVTIVFTCTDGDVDYFYNNRMNIPVIGVEGFRNDKEFQYYLDIIFTIHNFWNRAEMWTHFFRFPRAFSPVIQRIQNQYGTYLEEWTPNVPSNEYYPSASESIDTDGYNEIQDNEIPQPNE